MLLENRRIPILRDKPVELFKLDEGRIEELTCKPPYLKRRIRRRAKGIIK